jgi:hypothetical protein
MDTSTLMPPINLVEDFQSLQLIIFDDDSGEKTRGLARYFQEACEKCVSMRMQATEYEDKKYAQMLEDAFDASKRIVLFAWEKAHGTSLNV